MARTFRVGDCVRIPDGRIGRVREASNGTGGLNPQRHPIESSETRPTAEGRAKRLGEYAPITCADTWRREG
jgi:hypothetical protein